MATVQDGNIALTFPDAFIYLPVSLCCFFSFRISVLDSLFKATNILLACLYFLVFNCSGYIVSPLILAEIITKF